MDVQFLASQEAKTEILDNAIFESLARSETARDRAKTFHEATGLSLRIVAKYDTGARVSLNTPENPFCCMVAKALGDSRPCLAVQAELRGRLSQKLSPHHVQCFAGLCELAVPMVAGGEHVATLFAGQVLVNDQHERPAFAPVAQALSRLGVKGDPRPFARAYAQTPVVTSKQFGALTRLLALFADDLARYAQSAMLSLHAHEPLTVARARDFVDAHLTEHVTMHQVASQVHLSRQYFCRVFKAGTGLTFTEYVCRLRLEKAKELLADPALRISDVAFAAGFQSIPYFGRTFRRCAGTSPTEYRTTLHHAPQPPKT